ncbi:isopenicillin N synthase family dioxygenase [Segeticoccus rhizosphaerae]|jgi:isopenicillin N synthase-like dioxygenase|uniref:isopenicillin N synthase family dioxygenase n=1 Tax=Segeticoccus rhizosphaerae TaxID=1104777 RepID=UPI0010BF9A71|nr:MULTISPECIES: 2-oxoglutarate and iron-dependent oxygenase domain-containing protein [Intrasporangiaceae]
MSSLPVLDLSLAADRATAPQFREDLRRATHDYGFFYLVGHGIDPALRHELLDVARRFFALPEADKLAIENVRSPHFRGYTRLGGERTKGRQDWREQVDVGPERPAREPGEADWDILEGPNQWPPALPELEKVLTRWNETLGGVALQLLREWAESLGQDRHVFDPAFADRPSTLTKVVRYPGRPAGESDQGVGEHKDSGVLTLLFVEPGKAGLQVERDGEWIDAPPVDGALIVNIGELLEVATDGYLKATVHRVITPQPDTDRISIPFFFNPALSARIPRLTLPQELARESRGVTVDADNPIHDTYGANALKSRMRAHPDVAARHHPELVRRMEHGR